MVIEEGDCEAKGKEPTHRKPFSVQGIYSSCRGGEADEVYCVHCIHLSRNQNQQALNKRRQSREPFGLVHCPSAIFVCRQIEITQCSREVESEYVSGMAKLEGGFCNEICIHV